MAEEKSISDRVHPNPIELHLQRCEKFKSQNDTQTIDKER